MSMKPVDLTVKTYRKFHKNKLEVNNVTVKYDLGVLSQALRM